MTAEQILGLLDGARPRGSDKWSFLCPAHPDRTPSGTMRSLPGKTLLFCWAGCDVQSMVAALGIKLSDLFEDGAYTSDPIVVRKHKAAEALEQWRQDELRRVAEDLRGRDIIIRKIDYAVGAGSLNEDEALVSLEYEYTGYSDLERRFDRLIRSENILDLWREAEAAA